MKKSKAHNEPHHMNSIEITEKPWGFVVKSCGMEAEHTAFNWKKGAGVSSILGALGLAAWMAPSVADPAQGAAGPTALALGGLGFLATAGARSINEVEVDGTAGEIRIVTRKSQGEATVKKVIPFTQVKAAGLKGVSADGQIVDLLLKFGDKAQLQSIAVGPGMDLRHLHARLTQEFVSARSAAVRASAKAGASLHAVAA